MALEACARTFKAGAGRSAGSSGPPSAHSGAPEARPTQHFRRARTGRRLTMRHTRRPQRPRCQNTAGAPPATGRAHAHKRQRRCPQVLGDARRRAGASPHARCAGARHGAPSADRCFCAVPGGSGAARRPRCPRRGEVVQSREYAADAREPYQPRAADPARQEAGGVVLAPFGPRGGGKSRARGHWLLPSGGAPAGLDVQHYALQHGKRP